MKQGDAPSKTQRPAAIQGCNLQAAFKQQGRGCNLQATKNCCHPKMQPSSNLQAIFKQLSSNRKDDALSKQQRTTAIQGCNLQTTFTSSREEDAIFKQQRAAAIQK